MTTITPTCDHGYETLRRTKRGESICPWCRRNDRAKTQRAAVVAATVRQPQLFDHAMAAAHDMDDDERRVIDLTTRRRSRTTPH